MYDYCIDDPVTMNDPAGLIAPLLVMGGILGAKALGVGLGWAGTYLAGLGADAAQKRTGRKGPSAADAALEVAPKTAGIATVSSLPVVATGLALGAPGAIGAIERGGQILSASRYGPALIKAGEIAEGVLNPNPSLAGPTASTIGSAVKRGYDELKNGKSFFNDLIGKIKTLRKDKEEMQPDPHTKQRRRWR